MRNTAGPRGSAKTHLKGTSNIQNTSFHLISHISSAAESWMRIILGPRRPLRRSVPESQPKLPPDSISPRAASLARDYPARRAGWTATILAACPRDRKRWGSKCLRATRLQTLADRQGRQHFAELNDIKRQEITRFTVLDDGTIRKTKSQIEIFIVRNPVSNVVLHNSEPRSSRLCGARRGPCWPAAV